MDNNKTKSVSKKKVKQGLMNDKTKTRLIAGLVITFFVISTVGYFSFQLGVPAMILSAGTVAGQDVKVTEMNYRFYEVVNMYRQYGMIQSLEDLEQVVNEETGETYRDMILKQAAENIQRTKILAAEGRKNGFVAEGVDNRVNAFVESIRQYASESRTTADRLLQNQYGKGITLRDVKEYLKEEYYSEEYAESLKQGVYSMTKADMQAKYDADPSLYDTVTYNTYLFTSKVDATVTDEALIQKGKEEAKKLADSVIAKAKDPATFLAACKELLEAENPTDYADGKDPTLLVDIDKKFTDALGSQFTAFVFDPARKANDTAVIETDAGYYAVLFQSRNIDTTASASYRVLTIEGTDLAASRKEIEGYQAQVTDEKSFISLVKKNSDDATAYAGGYYAGVVASDVNAEETTEYEKKLNEWLFAEGRKAGDMIVIENIDSVSLFYFSESMPAWMSTLNTQESNTKFEEWYTTLSSDPAFAYTINKENIKFAS
jgi:hypothetical protein